MKTAETDPRDIEKATAQVLTLWREVLGIADAGPDENFFDVGGTSLLAARLASRLSVELGRTVSTADVLANPSARKLAGKVNGTMSSMDRTQAEQRAVMQRKAFAAHHRPRG